MDLPGLKAGFKRVLAVDPGTWESGVIVYEYRAEEPDNGEILFKSKDMLNEDLLSFLLYGSPSDCLTEAAIEMIGFYGKGMTVGVTIFHTVLWIGRYYAALERSGLPVNLYIRKKIAVHLCGSAAAKKPYIWQACRDRLGERGTKTNPGKTYGVTDHAWDALALALSHANQIMPVDYPSVKPD